MGRGDQEFLEVIFMHILESLISFPDHANGNQQLAVHIDNILVHMGTYLVILEVALRNHGLSAFLKFCIMFYIYSINMPVKFCSEAYFFRLEVL